MTKVKKKGPTPRMVGVYLTTRASQAFLVAHVKRMRVRYPRWSVSDTLRQALDCLAAHPNFDPSLNPPEGKVS